MEREVGGGIGMGNTCKPMAVSFQCMTKFTTKKKKNWKKKKRMLLTVNNSNQYLERTLGRLRKRTGFQWVQWGMALGVGFIVFVMVPFWFLCSSSLPPVFSTEQPEEGMEGRGSRGKTCIHTYG